MSSELHSQASFCSFADDLFSALREPFIPLPSFRRDSFYFPTILQDLIGNYMDTEIQDPPEVIQQILDNREYYENNFTDSRELEELTKKRWLLKIGKNEGPSRYSLASQSTSAEGERANFILVFMNLLQKTIKVQCEGILVWMSQFTESRSLLKIYTLLVMFTQWEVFCSSIHYLESRLKSFTELINSTYDSKFPFEIRTPAYSIVRLMTITWRRKILSTTSNHLISSILERISVFRENLLMNSQEEPEDIDIIVRAVRALIDLSVTELNIYMTEHSQFETEGLYSVLSDKYISITEAFYEQLLNKETRVNQVLSIDYSIAKRIFLPCTLKKIELKNVEIRMECIKTRYLHIYKNYKINYQDPDHQPLVDTAFGQMIFNSDPKTEAKNQIRRFLNFLIYSNDIEEVYDYNKLNTRLEELKKDKTQEDFEIEFKNSQFDIISESCEEEKVLFSIANDLDYETFLTIRANKVSNN